MNCSGDCISTEVCEGSKDFTIIMITLFFSVIMGCQYCYIITRNRSSEHYLVQNNDIPPPYQRINSET